MKSGFLALLGAATLSSVSAHAGAGPAISDVKVTRAIGNGVLTLSASIAGPEGVFSPLVFWRNAGAAGFLAVQLQKKGARYEATFDTPEKVVEYFVEAFDEQGGGPTRVGSPQKPLTHPEGAKAPRKLAVLEFVNELDKAEKLDRVYFSDAVRGALQDAKRGFQVMMREKMGPVLVSGGKSVSECAQECESEAGRLLGVELVVVGRLSKLGKRYKLMLRALQTSDGAVLSNATASGESVEQLDDDLAKAVQKLLSVL